MFVAFICALMGSFVVVLFCAYKGWNCPDKCNNDNDKLLEAEPAVLLLMSSFECLMLWRHRNPLVTITSLAHEEALAEIDNLVLWWTEQRPHVYAFLDHCGEPCNEPEDHEYVKNELDERDQLMLARLCNVRPWLVSQ